MPFSIGHIRINDQVSVTFSQPKSNIGVIVLQAPTSAEKKADCEARRVRLANLALNGLDFDTDELHERWPVSRLFAAIRR